MIILYSATFWYDVLRNKHGPCSQNHTDGPSNCLAEVNNFMVYTLLFGDLKAYVNLLYELTDYNVKVGLHSYESKFNFQK